MPVVVGVVVFLLLLAAVCGLLAMWTILHEMRAGARLHRMVEAPVAALTVVPRRAALPPGVPTLPTPLPRRLVHASPTYLLRDDEEEDDYTVVDDGVTIIRDLRLAARR